MRSRRGVFGVLIPIVVIAMAGLVAFLAASRSVSTTAARVVLRSEDIRLAQDACRAALGAAVITVRRNLAGGPFLSGEQVRWIPFFTPPLEEAPAAGRVSFPCEPALAERFRQSEVALSPVEAEIIERYDPPGLKTARRLPYLPQGVMEMAVTATIDRAHHQVRRTLVERRVFYVDLATRLGPRGRRSRELKVALEQGPFAAMLTE